MNIELNYIKPIYMSEGEITPSDIYLQKQVLFEKGKKYLIKAQSGHGKTSFLNFIYGSSFHYEGSIKYDGVFSKKDVFELRKNKLSYVFQDYKLFPSLTAYENIQLKNDLTQHKTEHEINTLIDRVLLSHKRDTLVQNLSLGQRQRIAIIRALCQPFDYLLLDEPFSHLDNKNIEILAEIISQELQNQGASLIMTSLELSQVFEFDRILNL
ncbi:ATP-binding cassette domain-containing protein [Capnocytophaga stomatis]|nr:ATP-binding cassette domain-containing protein [Capnocytophaga stomatis]